ncbi:pyridoxamine 5'-phosphate oxidase family protein [Pseudaestuariivita atlantica]|uniref:General stress protein FMN-binding split barrel domain-containing protein n=1 Tax=Pseudaestuariivita atlantica TaxID=1317121 RepID=A0A0L1JQF2_9RHOB|nr:pyridoxamine 5'-phosphate oxidase family protein [Pseudaestuariivita atlantica]KNG93960.1 hypothetical protein ATO11_06740 [Pseudaestuariivita atlantica]
MPKDNTSSLSADDIWSALDSTRAGMLQTGPTPFIPMSHQIDRDASVLWFLTAADTAFGEEVNTAAQPARYVVADTSAGLHGTFEGMIRVEEDRARLDEIWSPIVGAWFDGKDDPDLRMLRFDLAFAEVWLSDGAAKFFFDIARANITGEEPDGGRHGTVTF